MPFGFNDNDQVFVQPQLAADVVYRDTQLLNGAAANANVNGSVTPVNFDFTPAASETWYLEDLRFFLSDSGSTAINNFGALAALTNGVDFLVRSKGVEYTFANIKTNRDIVMVFTRSGLISPTSGFLESADVYAGMSIFEKPFILQNSTSDYVRMRVRDNLTGLDYMQARAKVWRLN